MFKILKRTKDLEKRAKELEIVKEELEEAKATLEIKVKARTKELQERIDELERFYRLTVSRELKMTELKKENKKLKQELESLKK